MLKPRSLGQDPPSQPKLGGLVVNDTPQPRSGVPMTRLAQTTVML